MIILNYHGLTNGPSGDPWHLTQTQFYDHVQLFEDRLISPATFLARCSDPAYARSGDVLLTFDDGCRSDYTHAFPRHAGEAGPGFITFIVTDLIGRPDRVDWRMLEEMAKNGVTIGSHGRSHADLTTLSSVDLDREVNWSKLILEDRLGHSVSHFAFPYGRFNRSVWNAALQAGYTHLFTTQLGYHNGFEPFLYSRLCIISVMDKDYLASHLANPCHSRGLAWRLSSSMGLYRFLMRRRYR